jgi:hypothetical protein
MSPKEKSPKVAKKFECISCDYLCCKQSDFNKHLLTTKHKILQNPTLEDTQKHIFPCKCGKIYKHSSTLYAHKKICLINYQNENILSTDIIFDPIEQSKLVNYLMKENSDFKQLMIEQNKHMLELAKNSGHHNTSNSNNSFNLNFFLNETCKNAMNIMDFVSQLQVGIKELEETGRLGFAEGISKIFINGLKQIDISDRPVHCSDFKRETLYIKDNNQWNKESEDKTILTNAIKHVAHKNMKQISAWTKTHSEFNNSSSKENDKYLKIVSESMSGSSQEESDNNYNKIIKNIVKETIIDK